MTSKDLIDFSINQKWARARIIFCEQQKETIAKLSAVISDMPRGSRKVEDNEAESLTKLLDQIDGLKKQIEDEAVEMENKLTERLNKMEKRQGLLLYHHYILGDSIKYIAKEILHNEKKYTYKLRDKALLEFDKIN